MTFFSRTVLSIFYMYISFPFRCCSRTKYKKCHISYFSSPFPIHQPFIEKLLARSLQKNSFFSYPLNAIFPSLFQKQIDKSFFFIVQYTFSSPNLSEKRRSFLIISYKEFTEAFSGSGRFFNA